MTEQRRSLSSRKVLLGITGSVAAYKALDLIGRLKEEGASVTAVMTDASLRFLAPLSVETATGGKVYSGLFDDPMAHIGLARDADLMLIAPATANTVAKFAAGLAYDLLGTCFLAFRGAVVLAPAMNWRMYENPVFRENLDRLRAFGAVEAPPETGALACGEEGVGRMASTEAIVEAVKSALSEKDLAGEKIVVTAGPTREPLDAVRFISNRSSGKMGYALAGEARRRGAEVVLISGPSALGPPPGVDLIRVETAEEMRSAVLEEIKGARALVMAAAVADFAPASPSAAKLEKSSVRSIQLKPAPDILAEVGRMEERPLVVGFAAEAGDNVRRAEDKLGKKGVDVIVFNDISEPGAGFDCDTNRIAIIEGGRRDDYPLMSKEGAAGLVLDRVAARRA
jgi:phosphopantothenoylcysteine decarboxylase/phosphopantothenate--cysteine ligase